MLVYFCYSITVYQHIPVLISIIDGVHVIFLLPLKWNAARFINLASSEGSQWRTDEKNRSRNVQILF
jgi:hypothetical protein